MRILIIGPPRSGTTRLCEGLGSLLDCNTMMEPFNKLTRKKTLKKWPLVLEKNVVVKILSMEKPLIYESHSKFIKDFTEQFDRVILLSRKNKKEHFESFLNLMNRLQNDTTKTHTKWNIRELNLFNHTMNYDNDLKPWVDIMIEISKTIDKEIIYYEDLYGADRKISKKIINTFNIPCNSNKLNEYLHPKYRYRIEPELI